MAPLIAGIWRGQGFAMTLRLLRAPNLESNLGISDLSAYDLHRTFSKYLYQANYIYKTKR